ncbi:MAG: ribosome assembly RNA-binding protein YhbY [Candidatus Latescibacteria bacterium]|nr:ribosome assembly RNA-binding protein YhbY [Candidatus Latescibacterota bacterium]
MATLKGSQRTYLRSLAHHLQPVVHVGRDGVTEGLVEAVDQALGAHELIKVRFLEHKTEKKALHQEIAQKTRSHPVGMVGHVAILYRQHPDEEKRKIEIPDHGR